DHLGRPEPGDQHPRLQGLPGRLRRPQPWGLVGAVRHPHGLRHPFDLRAVPLRRAAGPVLSAAMVENRPFLNILTHLVLIAGVVVIAFPVYVAVIAMTHSQTTLSLAAPLLPGGELVANIVAVWNFDPPGLPPF